MSTAEAHVSREKSTKGPDTQDPPADTPIPAPYPGWRRLHLLASWLVVAIAIAHTIVAALTFRTWSPDAVWFLGTGLAILLIGTMNLTHIGLEPCRMPTVRFVRAANILFALFGLASLLAVPEPQTVVLVIALVAQVLAGRITLPGPT